MCPHLVLASAGHMFTKCLCLCPVWLRSQVAETLPAEVLAKMHAPAKAADVPVLDPHDLDKVRHVGGKTSP